MFNPYVIIEWLSYLCLIALFVSRPFRKRRLLKRAGNCLLPLARKNTLVPYAGIFIVSACMLAILRLRSFDFVIALVLRITAVLAAELAVRDAVCKDAAGVYENMLIAGGKTIPKTGIVRLCDVDSACSGEGQEADGTRNTALVLQIDTAGPLQTVVVSFDNGIECAGAKRIIQKWLAEKAPKR